ncbi:hypothetical protein NDU88_009773 [Pleurodeles waltl]|uniref:Uncharacterized protein n=1 Tax=Pleurodeles waltl TaxID=8319 RepID=A0AAV7PT24_PLEWA|nr:hypothetical protein NDU88_009773 [Pleurodeles waltl]
MRPLGAVLLRSWDRLFERAVSPRRDGADKIAVTSSSLNGSCLFPLVYILNTLFIPDVLKRAPSARAVQRPRLTALRVPAQRAKGSAVPLSCSPSSVTLRDARPLTGISVLAAARKNVRNYYYASGDIANIAYLERVYEESEYASTFLVWQMQERQVQNTVTYLLDDKTKIRIVEPAQIYEKKFKQ